jgi:hypothetical protein
MLKYKREPLIERTFAIGRIMSIQIFYFEGSDGGFEQWLTMGDDGTMTYITSPNRYAFLNGEEGEYTKLSVDEAKERWPRYSKEIDAAAAQVKSRR